MKNKFKRLIFLILLGVMLLSASILTYALEENADAGEGSEATQDGVFDGASYAKTGYLIYGSDEFGRANTPVVFVSSYGNMPSGKDGRGYIDGRVTRFGDSVSTEITTPVVWGFSPFNSSGDGMGDAIGAWLKSDYKDGYKGAEWVLVNYLGLNDDDLGKYLSEENYINVETVMWAGLYDGTSYKGMTFCGTARTWSIMTDSRNYLGRYTHQNVPNSLVYDKEGWLGLAVPSDITSRHESAEITGAVGYGIVSVRCKPGDKDIIKVYRTQGVVDQTTYGTTDKHVTIKDEGSYKAKQWFVSKKKTTKKTPKRDFPEFESELPKTRGGNGPGDVDLTEEEKTIVILYEREKEDDPPRGENEDTLKAHELNYVFPNMASTGDTETASRVAISTSRLYLNNKRDLSKLYEVADAIIFSRYLINY